QDHGDGGGSTRTPSGTQPRQRRRRRSMTDANPAFDTVHPSGHILVRSCRGGYMHSVALSAEAMDTDASTLAQGILLTADVSCLKALLEVRDEIVAAGHTPSPEVPTPHDLDAAIEKLLAHQLRRRRGPI